MPSPFNLHDWFGEIDIYLFDQLLKGRLQPGDRVLDAGCGDGRNLPYFLRCGWKVCAVDRSTAAVDQVRRMAARLAPSLPAENFRVEPVDQLSFPDGAFDVVISSAVLHFADHEEHFDQMVAELWRVLRAGGMLFARLASSIGIEDRVEPVRGRRAVSPDGVERFLVDEALLLRTAAKHGGELLEPIKSTIVQDQRCMTTWCLRKCSGGE